MKSLSLDTAKSKMADVERMLEGNIDATSQVLSEQLGINRNFIAFTIYCM
jgi:hypothetical protein